jgi:hypothetical protein
MITWPGDIYLSDLNHKFTEKYTYSIFLLNFSNEVYDIYLSDLNHKFTEK